MEKINTDYKWWKIKAKLFKMRNYDVESLMNEILKLVSDKRAQS